MPIPATTGQLRTRVQDMEIGDYIKANVYAGSISSMTSFRGFNDNPSFTTECPVTGIQAGQVIGGFGYMVKIAKGLLVFDRIAFHSYSWDNLNTYKCIQGYPWDAGNIIPTMTSNTSPSGEASASSEYNTTSKAFKAFDKATGISNNWYTSSGVTTGWLAYDFEVEKTIRRYAINVGNSDTLFSRAPKDWTFEGSNDGGLTWTVLDTRKGITWSASALRQVFTPSQIGSFKLYRINVTANNGDVTFVGITEFEMMETAGIIRSLSGGVAFADTNGNSSTTDQGLGGWPMINEWDKFIANFPTSKIQAGKTLDDVFHWSGVGTLTQDTPVLNADMTVIVTDSTRRVYRGRYSIESIPTSPSNLVASTIGFRPVFEYLE